MSEPHLSEYLADGQSSEADTDLLAKLVKLRETVPVEHRAAPERTDEEEAALSGRDLTEAEADVLADLRRRWTEQAEKVAAQRGQLPGGG